MYCLLCLKVRLYVCMKLSVREALYIYIYMCVYISICVRRCVCVFVIVYALVFSCGFVCVCIPGIYVILM